MPCLYGATSELQMRWRDLQFVLTIFHNSRKKSSRFDFCKATPNVIERFMHFRVAACISLVIRMKGKNHNFQTIFLHLKFFMWYNEGEFVLIEKNDSFFLMKLELFHIYGLETMWNTNGGRKLAQSSYFRNIIIYISPPSNYYSVFQLHYHLAFEIKIKSAPFFVSNHSF